jgi:hypothetical protein
MPPVGVKVTLVIGAVLDILLGACLLRWSKARRQRLEAFAGLIAGMFAASVIARAEILDPQRLASGVYRYGKVNHQNRPVNFYVDGKTASIAVYTSEGRVVTITSNGKPDASIRFDPDLPPLEDEYTMTIPRSAAAADEAGSAHVREHRLRLWLERRSRAFAQRPAPARYDRDRARQWSPARAASSRA